MNFIKTIAVSTVALIAFSVFSHDLPAAVPEQLRYQGVLTNTSGSLLTGSFNLTFRIYDTQTTGNLLWSETQPNVSVSRGLFSVSLGSVTPLNLLFDRPYWLSIKVGTDGEMVPRQALTSVPYALRAATAADSVGGIRHLRSGLEVTFSTTSIINISAGVLSFDGTAVVSKTATSTLDIGMSGNYVGGAPAANQNVWVIVDSAGNFKLTATAPNASDTDGTAVGRLQYRSFSGIYYRYLGSVRADTATTYMEFYRHDRLVTYVTTSNVLDAGISSTYAAVSLSSRIPATSTMALLHVKVSYGVDPEEAFIRPTGSSATGNRILFSSGTNQGIQMVMPTNMAQSIDYKVRVGSGSSTMTIDVNGYYDNLD